MDLKARLSNIEVKYGFRPSPVLDQFFVTDEGLLERIIRHAQLTEEDTVLEIGAGAGFLTQYLAKAAGKVISVEIDQKLQPVLEGEFSEYNNVEFIFDDFLKTNVPSFNKTVSNIPYSASAPITFKLLDYNFDTAILMYQKEFAEKMVAEAGDENYGRLSVMVQYYYDVQLLELVNKFSFTPMPKVNSAIIRLKKKQIPRDHDFDIFIREIFRYRNKDIRNAIRTAFKKDIEDNRKVRSLNIEELIKVYNLTK